MQAQKAKLRQRNQNNEQNIYCTVFCWLGQNEHIWEVIKIHLIQSDKFWLVKEVKEPLKN